MGKETMTSNGVPVLYEEFPSSLVMEDSVLPHG
jgi:hypothetical protein